MDELMSFKGVRITQKNRDEYLRNFPLWYRQIMNRSVAQLADDIRKYNKSKGDKDGIKSMD